MTAEPNGSTPKIGEPTKELPPSLKGKFALIWKKAGALAEGEWLPVEFDTEQSANRFAAGSRGTAALHGLMITVRGNIAYVGKWVQR